MYSLNIYIDGNNLYRSAKELNFEINYSRFRNWLQQKYRPTNVYLFIGLVPKRKNFYNYLRKSGYILIFKQIISTGEKIKGNCDAELVLKVISDFYERKNNSTILITGDGDFGCLVNFLKDKKSTVEVLAPDKNKCSFLLRNKNIKITFLNDLYHKFSDKK
jgi:uncharacterized LabA/DUF88 family protein